VFIVNALLRRDCSHQPAFTAARSMVQLAHIKRTQSIIRYLSNKTEVVPAALLVICNKFVKAAGGVLMCFALFHAGETVWGVLKMFMYGYGLYFNELSGCRECFCDAFSGLSAFFFCLLLFCAQTNLIECHRISLFRSLLLFRATVMKRLAVTGCMALILGKQLIVDETLKKATNG
jgi:hypothetical protein